LDEDIGYLDTHKLDTALKEYNKKRQHDSKDDQKNKTSCKPEVSGSTVALPMSIYPKLRETTGLSGRG
jgi:hypothetical protein